MPSPLPHPDDRPLQRLWRRAAPVGLVVLAAFVVGWWLGARDDDAVPPSAVELQLDTDGLTLLPSSSLRPPNHDPVPYHELVPRLEPPPRASAAPP